MEDVVEEDNGPVFGNSPSAHAEAVEEAIVEEESEPIEVEEVVEEPVQDAEMGEEEEEDEDL